MRPEEPGVDRPFGIDQYPEHFNKPAQHHHYPHPDCAECQATLKRRKEEILRPLGPDQKLPPIKRYDVKHHHYNIVDFSQALRIIGYGFFSIGIGIIVAAALFVTYLNGQG